MYMSLYIQETHLIVVASDLKRNLRVMSGMRNRFYAQKTIKDMAQV